MKRVLIVDALNTYLRNYVINPSLSDNGEPVGGMKGFLMSLQKYCREMRPDEIFIIWDGPGGSTKKKKIDRGYKAGRKPVRLNRNVRLLNENEELENKIWQQTRLIEYLNYMPVCQILVEQVEADDIIALLTQLPEFEDSQKIIVSSDKDFLQCCDDKTIIYQPIKKKFVSRKTILEEYKIHPNNFALARSMAGDKSDNLAGVPGVGMGTVVKKLSFLSESKTYTIDDIIDFCNDHPDDKMLQKIVAGKKEMEIAYKIMQLYSPNISFQTHQKVLHSVENYPKTFNKTSVLKMMIEDGINVVSWNDLFIFYNNLRLSEKRRAN